MKRHFQQQIVNEVLFQEYLKNVTFHYKDELVVFDDNGDPLGHYDIMNFQKVRHAGIWDNFAWPSGCISRTGLELLI